MDVPTEAELIDRIVAFRKRHGMTETGFGVAARGEGGFLKSLREGRSPSLKTVRETIEFMAAYDAEHPAPSSGDPGESNGAPGGSLFERMRGLTRAGDQPR